MIKNMLMAASKMLDKTSKDDELQLEFAARVSCAKTVIDEIVAGMEVNPVNFRNNNVDPVVSHKSKIPLSENAQKAKITAEHGKIKTIEGVDLDTTIIELDGVQMTCAEAIGKAFQHGKIL